ncbi:LacI family transcriptional regulator [Rhodococcus sp. RS1C4]|uniref:LacI family DNA-binding transcriptional regulator n=1 Tax=Rhodococcoides fascians TaxID=1828 RepID=UPI00056B9915|nr:MULTISPECIES: LacI family DNA-binding transcriptional regulator [Rhodococcus]OZC41409.1 LacI family transcriptional regulator [Rhodococcus sp. RS1C4]
MANGKSATMQDIANRVGVSKALVSMIFRDVPGPSAETRARVLAVADELDYRPNRAAALMTLRRTHMLGVVANIRNAFHAEMVEHMVAAADSKGYEVVLGAVTPTHGESAVIETLLDFRCEAVVILGSESSAQSLRSWSTRVPLIVVGRRVSGVAVVRATDRRGMSAVVDHLVSLGHSRIAHLSGGSNPIAVDRRDGYTRAMRRHGLAEFIEVFDGDFTEVSGTDAGLAVRDHPGTRPTAIVAANDRSAVGLLDALQVAGIVVPEHISVTGYDNSTLAQLGHIALTTVSQEPADQADRAIELAVDILDNDRTNLDPVVLVPRLIVRNTTGPAPIR